MKRRALIIGGAISVAGAMTHRVAGQPNPAAAGLEPVPGNRPPQGDWYRFTESARSVISTATQYAAGQHADSIGTEYLLLGLTGNKESAAMQVLQRLGVPVDALRLQIEAEIIWNSEATMQEQHNEQAGPPLSARAKRVLEIATDEARRMPLQEKYVGSEHLLLALLRDREDLPVSYTLLRRSGLTIEKTRLEVINYLRGENKLKKE